MGNKNIKKVKTEGFPNPSQSPINQLNESIKKISLSNTDKNTQSDEEKVIRIVKKHNKESQDAKLIDECLAKHFFFFVIRKTSKK